jgi:AraC-like DNA-binding protein
MKISCMKWDVPIRGIERMEAFLHGHAFAPHRHDTYAVGLTLTGIQAFHYRGSIRYSLPGQAFVLHPDEAHDGRAGDERGFGYRIAYIDPALIREAAGLNAMPFLCDPVSDDADLCRSIAGLLGAKDSRPDELALTCSLVSFADALVRAAGCPAATPANNTTAVRAVRDLLSARLDSSVSLAELEMVSGLSRWQLTRQFRAAFGVSPARFHLLRRLDRARVLVRSGRPLAEVAHECGFADQAHFTRRFRSAYGLSPGVWAKLSRELQPARIFDGQRSDGRS